MAAPTLSIVVPVYNEEDRLPRMLAELRDAAQQCRREGLELVEIRVVDDGSTDGTVDLLRREAASDPLLAPVYMQVNRGKGAVVAAGIRDARGELSLITDVDLSTPLGELGALYRPIRDGWDIAIGSRALERDKVDRSLYRDVMSRGYNLLVRALTGLPYRDTQCGFKLVPTAMARALLHDQLIERYAFDVETLLRARAAGLSVAEVPVAWVQDGDSRVTPIPTALKMALDTLWIVYCLRWRRDRGLKARRPMWGPPR